MSEQQIYSDTQAEQINSLLERFNALSSEQAQQQWLTVYSSLYLNRRLVQSVPL